MLVLILICSIAIPTDDCTEKTARNVVALPEHPIVCTGIDAMEYAGQLADMIEEGKEYAKVICQNGRRV